METKIHRVRYYNPMPEPINCVSFNKTTKLLALARRDASIEIWDLNYAPFLLKFIPGVADGSVEALGWVNDRLLATGLSGALVEWDLETYSIKTTVILTGYAAWCLDVNSSNTLVAVGTEQGYVNMYSVENDEIIYNKLFDKQEGRIMCCKFDKSGNTLVTGSVDTIRVWNVQTGHATCRISVTRRGKETIVWCLAVLSDNVVVSGDSHGRLTFWDSALGEQIESYTTHKADILSIVVSEDEKSLYCTGMDPVIINFIKVNKSAGKQTTAQWVKNVQRNIHEHDVRALVLHGNKLISVGIDGYLVMSSYPPKWVMRIPPMIPLPRTIVCAQKKLLLLRYKNHLEVWKLGLNAISDSGDLIFNKNLWLKENGQRSDRTTLEQDSEISAINNMNGDEIPHPHTLKLTDKPVKLVSIQTKGHKQIRCCDLSPSGEFVVYSTDSDIRMLRLETDEEQCNVSVTKVSINGLSSFCDRVAFTEDSHTLVAHRGGVVYVLQVDPVAGATVVQTIPTDKYLKKKSILHLVVSKQTASNATYLVVADTDSCISVWIRTTKKFEHYVTLPKYRCVPCAMMVNSETETLVFVYVDQKIVEYSLANKRLSLRAVPARWISRRAAVTGLAPRRNALALHDDTSLWVLPDAQDNNEGPTPKKKKQSSNPDTELTIIIPVKYLGGFHWIADDEAVSIEILPENIVSRLPPVLPSKRPNI
ncbi:U3 small nucleolar RNA-associated protein 4 homolog [Epargyreus clarus]|uniref:U3 small nucleolar RNA-associated protein 4 homolog n=1 Tax=Epargyreus clarus TaxID=520877 RepID=UPI003C303C52